MKPAHGPDFSQLDSQAKVEAAFRRGELEKLFLLPLDFGGQDVVNNVLYVPIGVADIKDGIDANIIGPLVADGTVMQYKAEPQYQGDSFVLSSLTITAWDPGEFTTTINIWGDALARNKEPES
jgi:hypothetical protein